MYTKYHKYLLKNCYNEYCYNENCYNEYIVVIFNETVILSQEH